MKPVRPASTALSRSVHGRSESISPPGQSATSRPAASAPAMRVRRRRAARPSCGSSRRCPARPSARRARSRAAGRSSPKRRHHWMPTVHASHTNGAPEWIADQQRRRLGELLPALDLHPEPVVHQRVPEVLLAFHPAEVLRVERPVARAARRPSRQRPSPSRGDRRPCPPSARRGGPPGARAPSRRCRASASPRPFRLPWTMPSGLPPRSPDLRSAYRRSGPVPRRGSAGATRRGAARAAGRPCPPPWSRRPSARGRGGRRSRPAAAGERFARGRARTLPRSRALGLRPA